MYYIISLTHTYKKDNFITLWRPNNAGYTYFKAAAGTYEKPEVGYHDSEDNMPVHVDILNELFVPIPDADGIKKEMLLNSPAIWQVLNIKMGRENLVKKPVKKMPEKSNEIIITRQLVDEQQRHLHAATFTYSSKYRNGLPSRERSTIIIGKEGSGKSTLAMELASRYDLGTVTFIQGYRNFDLDKNPFIFSECTHNTKLIVVFNLPATFQIDKLISLISGYVIVNDTTYRKSFKIRPRFIFCFNPKVTFDHLLPNRSFLDRFNVIECFKTPNTLAT